jgi:hypothetical protein
VTRLSNWPSKMFSARTFSLKNWSALSWMMQAVRCAFSCVKRRYLAAELAHRVRAEARRQVVALLVARLAREDRVHPRRVLHRVDAVQKSLAQDRNRNQVFLLFVAHEVRLLCQSKDVSVRQALDDLFGVWEGHDRRQGLSVQGVVEEAHCRSHEVRQATGSQKSLPMHFQVAEAPVLTAKLLHDLPRPLLRQDALRRVLEINFF